MGGWTALTGLLLYSYIACSTAGFVGRLRPPHSHRSRPEHDWVVFEVQILTVDDGQVNREAEMVNHNSFKERAVVVKIGCQLH